AGAGVAGARVVALIRGRADDGVRARAGSGLAGIRLGTRIAIVTYRAVGLVRVGAAARGRIACTRDVALIGSRADDRVGAGADSGLAGFGLGARVAVVACRAVGLVRVGAAAGARIACTRDVALIGSRADDRVGANALARAVALVSLRAGIAVVAGSARLDEGV